MTRRYDDACWERVLDSLDLDMTELARAEERLEQAGDDPLPARWVEDAVARAAGPRPRIVAWTPRRLSRVAALVIASLLAIAMGVYLIWPEGRDSTRTMSYAEAIAILEDPGQPGNHKRSAFLQVDNRVTYGIETLQALRDDLALPDPVREAASQGLEGLRVALSSGAGDTTIQVDDSLVDQAFRGRQPQYPVTVRVRHLERIAQLTSRGIIAMRSDSVQDDRHARTVMKRLEELLAK
jgi:hypothetical protein